MHIKCKHLSSLTTPFMMLVGGSLFAVALESEKRSQTENSVDSTKPNDVTECMFMACYNEAVEAREVYNEFSHVFSAKVCEQHAKYLDNGGTMSVLFQQRFQ